MTTTRCDFCSAANPMWEYAADSFFDLCGSRSLGAWLACDDCHAVIEAGDREGMVTRAMLNPAMRAATVDKRGPGSTSGICTDGSSPRGAGRRGGRRAEVGRHCARLRPMWLLRFRRK
jgi:hypothetical protein